MVIYTIGHGTRSIDELIDILKNNNINYLIDVRSYPMSYTNPQFNIMTLKPELKRLKIKYEWVKILGGFRPKTPEAKLHTALRVASFRNYAGWMMTPDFFDGIHYIEKLSKEYNVAIMCSETVWYKCHRRMISDMLVKRHNVVYHLGMSKHPIKHIIWDIARKKGKYLLYDTRAMLG
jgi:uncharacterized protein (DUF488 family)